MITETVIIQQSEVGTPRKALMSSVQKRQVMNILYVLQLA